MRFIGYYRNNLIPNSYKLIYYIFNLLFSIKFIVETKLYVFLFFSKPFLDLEFYGITVHYRIIYLNTTHYLLTYYLSTTNLIPSISISSHIDDQPHWLIDLNYVSDFIDLTDLMSLMGLTSLMNLMSLKDLMDLIAFPAWILSFETLP